VLAWKLEPAWRSNHLELMQVGRAQPAWAHDAPVLGARHRLRDPTWLCPVGTAANRLELSILQQCPTWSGLAGYSQRSILFYLNDPRPNDMADQKDQIPVERFMAFMEADCEGDIETADRLAQEMVDIDGVAQCFVDDRLSRRANKAG